jgi:hypothetical protein
MGFMLVDIECPTKNVEGKVESGRVYQVNFNGFYTTSGLYFYSRISEKTRIIKKMVLIKR